MRDTLLDAAYSGDLRLLKSALAGLLLGNGRGHPREAARAEGGMCGRCPSPLATGNSRCATGNSLVQGLRVDVDSADDEGCTIDLLQKEVPQLEMYNKTNLCNPSHCHKVPTMDQPSVRPPKGIDKLKNLHMFGTFMVGKGSVARRLEQLTDLQSLGVTVTCLSEKGSQELCQSIGKLDRLQKLEVRSSSLEFLANMDATATKHLASLKLLGRISLFPTAWISSLNDLIKVKLVGTSLEQGHVDILGGLRSVAFLGLWEKSYKGDSLRFNTGKFPKLKFLDIDGLERIKKVRIKNGAMPMLEQLWVQNCKELRDSGRGLSGVPGLENLNELLVKECGIKENLMKTLQLQVSQHSRRPKFLIGKSILLTSSNPSTSAVAE